MVSQGSFDFKYYHCCLSVPSFIFVGLQVFILLILLFDVMIFYFLKIWLLYLVEDSEASVDQNRLSPPPKSVMARVG